MLLIHCFNKPSVRFIYVLVNTFFPLVSLNLFLCNCIFMLFFCLFVMHGLSSAAVFVIFLLLIQTTGSCGVWTEQKGVGRDNRLLKSTVKCGCQSVKNRTHYSVLHETRARGLIIT